MEATHDAARYIFDQASYALAAATHNDWTETPGQPQPSSKHYSNPPATRLTRKQAAALAKQNEPPNEQQGFQNYSPSRYLNDDPQIALDGDQSGPYATPASLPPNVYSYQPGFPSDDAPPISPTSPTAANGPSHPPPPPHQLGAIHPASLASFHPFPPPPGMMVPGRSDAYVVDDLPAATMYGPSSLGGTEMMRVPSASPSVASGSPPPEDFAPPADYQLPSSRGSSRPKSLENYEYPTSGPISPLSASYAPQPLPSTFSSATRGYLHGPSASQASHKSANSIEGASDQDLALASPDPTPNGGGRKPNQKTKTKLTDMDRKFICVFAQNHPKARQEDIATKFAVERSTVSKILKCKEKWMKVDFFSSEARVVKHRPSKFPELEAALINHIRMRIASREPVNDSFIKKTALELASARGIGKDKFKASSGWVENFKHRHDLRKGGLWDKSGSASWAAAAAAAKYSQGGGGEANGHAVGSIGSNEDGGGEEDYPEDSQFSHYQTGAEESNPLDEATTSEMPSMGFHPDLGQNLPQPSYPPPHTPAGHFGAESSSSNGLMYPPHPKIAGLDNSPPEAGSPTAKQGPNPDFFPVEGASPFASVPYGFYTNMQHLTTPRSASVTSRSTSNSSGPSIGGSPASVQSSVLSGGRHGSPASVSPPSPNQRRFSGLPPNSVAQLRSHGHRRSMSGSGSYTSSPLAVEVGAEATPGPSSLALHGVPHPYITPSRPSKRSVTFSSFSAMAAGLNLDSSNDGGRVPTRKDSGASRYGHSRSISQGSSGLGQSAITASPQQGESSFGSPHTIAHQ